MRKVGYVAHDHGPRATLEALAARLPGSAPETCDLLICGTSDTAAGRALEAAARRQARARGAAVVVVEDFPGNYAAVQDGAPELVFVESRFAAALATEKDASRRVEICPAVRYDALRRRLGELRQGLEDSKDAVLWIGQPETRDSLETLKRLLPALEGRGIAVWFRAHPRDEGYSAGAYAGLEFEDLTARPLEECFARRPRLVITQFSSVAIEAGFWGICAVNALFADLGARTLMAKKGYAVPPWCEEGAAFPILHRSDVMQVLDRALGSREARARVLEAFDRVFQVREEGAQRLINVLYNHGLL